MFRFIGVSVTVRPNIDGLYVLHVHNRSLNVLRGFKMHREDKLLPTQAASMRFQMLDKAEDVSEANVCPKDE